MAAGGGSLRCWSANNLVIPGDGGSWWQFEDDDHGGRSKRRIVWKLEGVQQVFKGGGRFWRSLVEKYPGECGDVASW
jgi:hypothetical protein